MSESGRADERLARVIRATEIYQAKESGKNAAKEWLEKEHQALVIQLQPEIDELTKLIDQPKKAAVIYLKIVNQSSNDTAQRIVQEIVLPAARRHLNPLTQDEVNESDPVGRRSDFDLKRETEERARATEDHNKDLPFLRTLVMVNLQKAVIEQLLATDKKIDDTRKDTSNQAKDTIS